MKALIWKEWRENLRWVPLPGLAILLVFLIQKPLLPIPEVTGAFFYSVIAVIFGAALGFLQIFFEAHGDNRSLLLHRPLSPSRIFLAKALAGVGLYALALGIPFACLEGWLATPGKMPAPYHWRTSLPWLADILSGLVYYFAGMLVAQRKARWFGGRVLTLACAFFCSFLVWIAPEFWHALVILAIFSAFMGIAAWGSFRAGGAYASQPRLAKASLAMTFLAGLTIISMFGKQMIGAGFDPGIEYQYDLDRQGRLLYEGFKPGVGQVGAVTYVEGQELTDLKPQAMDYAPDAFMETPLFGSYRHSGRFYVQVNNDSKPSQEIWYYDQTRRRLLGYDTINHQSLGGFGPTGFTAPGERLGAHFQGNIRYRANRWHAINVENLAFPDGVYTVDFYHRKIKTLFTPANGQAVTFADRWQDLLDKKRTGIVVATDKSFHFLTKDGAPVISVPRVFSHEKHGYVYAGPLQNPERYFVWYQSWQTLLEPQEFQITPGYVLEYDAGGNEIARRTVPPVPFPVAARAEALFGLVTPLTEAAILVGATRYLRSEERLQGSMEKSVLLRSLEDSRYYIPGTSKDKVATAGLIRGYIALILLSALACALGCFLLARRYAFACVRCVGWALMGFFFGWVGLLLLVAIQEWPARVICPGCRKLRVVTRDTCEHCGAPHTLPQSDGTEILEKIAEMQKPSLATC